MSRAARLAIMLAALAALTACETTGNRAAYESPLRKAGLPTAPATDTATAATPREGGAAPAAATVVGPDGAVRYDGIDYSFGDLSPGKRPEADTDEAGLWMVMDRTERETSTAGNLVADPELNVYVAEVACGVVGDYCDDLRVYLIRRAAFNASMAPNGMMSVWTGLLLRVRNEAQLATVLGHELGHYLRRHSLQRMRDMIAKTNGLIFFQLAVGAAGAAPLGDLATLGVLGSIQSYSRDHEREADGYGLLFMYQAGYDTREAAKIWDQLLREAEADPDRERPSLFFASHPASAERRDVLSELGAVLQVESRSTETGRERFLAVTLPRRGDWLRDELHRRTFAGTDVMLDALLVDDPNPAELLFFKGEVRRLRLGDDDDAAALELYDRALAAAGTPPVEVHRSRGVVLARRGDTAAAAAAFRTYLELAPDAGDRLIIEDMIGRLGVS
jgi:tetratricopeptide (TPR) repeat protein